MDGFGRKDIIFECGFYGRKPSAMGCMYFCPKQSEVENPELLFVAYYILKLLTHKKISFSMASLMKEQLSQQRELLESKLSEAREGKESLGIKVVDYKSSWNNVFSASMYLKNHLPFRLGYIGFGLIFKNKKKICFCAEKSMFGLLYTMYVLHGDDKTFMDKLWKLVKEISGLSFGKDLDNRNYTMVAQGLVAKISE